MIEYLEQLLVKLKFNCETATSQSGGNFPSTRV